MDSKLLSGTLELMILQVVGPKPTYGYQITQEVLQRSEGYFGLKEGSLYPALHRMERDQLLKSHWVETDSGRRRKYYRLTPDGQKALEKKKEDWERFALGVNGVLGAQSHVVA